jgi:hypothetical protein
MPRLDGVEATTRIRQFDAATPVISMSSNMDADDLMLYFSSGMNDVLPKPFNRETVRAVAASGAVGPRWLTDDTCSPRWVPWLRCCRSCSAIWPGRLPAHRIKTTTTIAQSASHQRPRSTL